MLAALALVLAAATAQTLVLHEYTNGFGTVKCVPTAFISLGN